MDVASAVRLERAVKETLAQGARVVVGGQVDTAARRMAPTVLSGVLDDSPIMDDEIFGPVLPLLTYRDLGDAIRRVQGRHKPLALYVFSKSNRQVEQVLRSTSAGGTCVNNAVLHLANPHLPFGGVGESGMGHYHGRWGFEALSHPRAVLHQGFWSNIPFLHPPYTANVARILALFRMVVG